MSLTPTATVLGGGSETTYEISDSNFDGSTPMTVTLYTCGIEPVQIIHEKEDGTNEYFYPEYSEDVMADGQNPFYEFRDGEGNGYVSFDVTEFSDITILVVRVPETPAGAAITGTVTSYGDDEMTETTLQLIPSGEAEAVKTIRVAGTGEKAYSIPGVQPGSYTLKVMKANHITKEYPLTVDTSDLVQNVKIQLRGDINGDGLISGPDVEKAHEHVKGLTLLTGYELACADVKESGAVNISDVGQINAYAKGSALMPLALPGASTCTFTVEADRTTANPGDVITFTVYMKQTEKQNTLEGTLVIPDGLTFVPGSGQVEAGVSAALGWTQELEGIAWTESTKKLTGFGVSSFTGTDPVALMRFQCKVNNDAALQGYSITLSNVIADDENYETKNPVCVPASITVSAPLHTHSLTKVEAKAADCTTDGNKEYYRCSSCGKLFTDAAGTTEISADQVVIKATGHDYQWVIDKEATSEKAGSKHEQCKICGDQKEAVEIPALTSTGDTSNWMLWTALLAFSGAGLLGAAVYIQKRKQDLE